MALPAGDLSLFLPGSPSTVFGLYATIAKVKSATCTNAVLDISALAPNSSFFHGSENLPFDKKLILWQHFHK
jgi:hypothetical protein